MHLGKDLISQALPANVLTIKVMGIPKVFLKYWNSDRSLV